MAHLLCPLQRLVDRLHPLYYIMSDRRFLMSALISTRFDEETLARLDEAVAALGQTRSGLIKDAVAHYLEYLTWYSAEVQKGIDVADAGLTRSHAEVKTILQEAGVVLD